MSYISLCGTWCRACMSVKELWVVRPVPLVRIFEIMKSWSHCSGTELPCTWSYLQIPVLYPALSFRHSILHRFKHTCFKRTGRRDKDHCERDITSYESRMHCGNDGWVSKVNVIMSSDVNCFCQLGIFFNWSTVCSLYICVITLPEPCIYYCIFS